MMRSLRLRLTIGALFAIGLAILMIWIALSRLFTGYVTDQYHTEMQVLSDSLAANLVFDAEGMRLEREPSDPRFNLPAGGRYWQINRDGTPSLRSRSLWDSEIKLGADASGDLGPFKEIIGPGGTPIFVHEQVMTFEGVAGKVTIHAAFEKAEIDDALSKFHGEMRKMLLATSLMLFFAAFLQGAVGLSPLLRLKTAVTAIRSGGTRYIADDLPSEVMPLVKEINLLIEERETALERARARASDLAHGLKTPLTVLAQLAESLPEGDRDTALKQVDIIRQRSDRQLQAARMGVEQMATTEIAPLILKLVQVFRPVTNEKGVVIGADIPDGLTIAMDAADLAEAIGNVLDNAVKYADTTIRIGATKRDERVILTIEDDGPGIAEDDIEAVFERGHTTGIDGTGLGLAITKDIVDAYGGAIRIEAAERGGAVVVLDFPERPHQVKVSQPH